MANYNGKCRTNYFSVADTSKLKDIINGLSGEGEIGFLEHDTEKGKFAFFCDLNLTGFVDDEDEDGFEKAFDLMVEKFQEILPDDEAIILTEIGNEKMCYLVGVATIITNKVVAVVNLEDYAMAKAREMLNNPNYMTQMDY